MQSGMVATECIGADISSAKLQRQRPDLRQLRRVERNFHHRRSLHRAASRQRSVVHRGAPVGRPAVERPGDPGPDAGAGAHPRDGGWNGPGGTDRPLRAAQRAHTLSMATEHQEPLDRGSRLERIEWGGRRRAGPRPTGRHHSGAAVQRFHPQPRSRTGYRFRDVDRAGGQSRRHLPRQLGRLDEIDLDSIGFSDRAPTWVACAYRGGFQTAAMTPAPTPRREPQLRTSVQGSA